MRILLATPSRPHFRHRGDHQHHVDACRRQIDPGPELVHPLGPQDLQPHELDGGHDGGEKQQNRHGIVDGKAGVALGPQHHEGAAHRHKTQKHAHEHDELQTACTGHQPPQLTGGGVGGHHAVYAGGQHIGDGHGEGQIVHVQLIGVIVYGAELRAMDPCGHQGTDTVVHLIHHHGDEHIEGKAHHALHEGRSRSHGS